MLNAMQDLMRPPAGLEFDFSQPAGEPALTPADGVTWRVFANPVSLFIGGVTAVLLELAEPSVGACGITAASEGIRGTRLRRTGFAAMMTVYGPRTATEAMISHVVLLHGKVHGRPGRPRLSCQRPRLLDGAQATASSGFTEAYHRNVRPLFAMEKSAVFAEGEPSARLYGAIGAPKSWAKWEALLAATAPGLEDRTSSTSSSESCSMRRSCPPRCGGSSGCSSGAALDITPAPVRNFPQLHGRGLRFGEAMLVRALGRVAAILPLGDMPTAQAARRLNADRTMPQE